MFPLWDVAIAPVLHAAQARSVVEIGALRGETTERMLDDLGPDAELDVIDPEPAFDPSDHEHRFEGRYRFHQGLSLDVIPTLGPVDAALIDGDHNWYTVYNELRLLAEGAKRHGTGLPVLILHDVLWPYGRRDLYYAPERIPGEFRQPWARAGMNPGVKRSEPRQGPEPGHVQRRAGGRAPQRCHDRARGLPRGVRPAGAQARAADLFRLWRSSWRRTGSRPSPKSTRRSIGSRAPRAGTSCWRSPRPRACGQ